MKKIIVSSLLVLCSIVSTGCTTLRDTGAAFDKPVPAAIIGAGIGGAIDKVVFNGDGTVGAVMGAALGYSMGERREERMAQNRPFHCNRRQHANYDANGRYIDRDSEDCRREYDRPANEDEEAKRDAYTYSRPSTAQSAGERVDAPTGERTRCHRYSADGAINAECR